MSKGRGGGSLCRRAASRRSATRIALPEHMAAPVVTKLRRELTAAVGFPSTIFTTNTVHSFLPFAARPDLTSPSLPPSTLPGPWHLPSVRPPVSTRYQRPLPHRRLIPRPRPRRALARPHSCLSIDDAGCAIDSTEQRRIIPCSQISEPRLRFRPRGRRYVWSSSCSHPSLAAPAKRLCARNKQIPRAQIGPWR